MLGPKSTPVPNLLVLEAVWADSVTETYVTGSVCQVDERMPVLVVPDVTEGSFSSFGQPDRNDNRQRCWQKMVQVVSCSTVDKSSWSVRPVRNGNM